MFLKQERPEIDDFVIKQISGWEGKILFKFYHFKMTKKLVLADTLAIYSCVSVHSKHFLFFQ